MEFYSLLVQDVILDVGTSIKNFSNRVYVIVESSKNRNNEGRERKFPSTKPILTQGIMKITTMKWSFRLNKYRKTFISILLNIVIQSTQCEQNVEIKMKFHANENDDETMTIGKCK